MLEHLHRRLVREQPVQREEEDVGGRFVAQDGGDASVSDLAVERLTLGVDPLTCLEELAPHGRADHFGQLRRLPAHPKLADDRALLVDRQQRSDRGENDALPCL